MEKPANPELESENKALQEKLKIADHLKELADDAIVTLQKENERLKNDLLDALDLKEGKGPTALSMAIYEIKHLREEIERLKGESRWISVKDRLPEPKEQVLVYQPPKKWSHKDEMTKGRVLIGYMFRLPQDERGTWIDLNELNDKACSLRQGGLFWAFPYICHQNFVTHWQPLTEPPLEK